ncbi:hypothetical protein ZIOFF_064161 [Zingiber officinale]|uniref:DUF7032 domain-containing protein n=1 Tax=Zingiber officinale TaxID=94328 RepID=A0A8J5CFF8_ZINOF|nr:hypothetical protein ZIOFF_064161 [Zingiber officinale]
MAEETEPTPEVTDSAAGLRSQARQLVPEALAEARAAAGFPARWSSIASKIERVAPSLSDLSSLPSFSRNALCWELLQSVTIALRDAIGLACRSGAPSGKLQMQSDLDAVSSELDLVLDDCALLVKTGVLDDSAAAAAAPHSLDKIRVLLARLQIGHAEAKNRAVDALLEAMREDERSVMTALGRSNVSALIRLLGSTSVEIKEKAATAICLLTESGSCENLIVSEAVLPPLIRLSESGSLICRQKALTSLQRLSISTETARSIVGHGGVRPLVDVCQAGDSICQSAASGTLKNLSAVPEVRQTLVEEGTICVMIDLLNHGIVLSSKEHSAECLLNLTASNDASRMLVVEEGGAPSLLAFLDGPLPKEPAVGALRNLIGAATVDSLVSLGLLPRLLHVLRDGSLGAQQAAASIICRISNSNETKRSIGELGCLPLLATMLEAITSTAREVAAQAIAGLISLPQNKSELKKDDKTVIVLVRLLDPNPQNTAKKYAISCLRSCHRARGAGS